MVKTFESPFGKSTFKFLKDLAKNNERDWFKANKSRYEGELKEPALAFITAFGPHLRKISPHFLAVASASGGSLFRIYRDTRFSKDKSPYKIHLGIQFRHESAKDVHCPGYYLHLEPGGSFVGAGIWHPESSALRAIRDGIVEQGGAWTKATSGKPFRRHFHLGGDSLKRIPRGFEAEHPLAEDLKRKDFIAVANLSDEQALASDLPAALVKLFKATSPLMKFLCKATAVPF